MKFAKILFTAVLAVLVVPVLVSANSIQVTGSAAMNSTNFGLEVTPNGTSTKAYVQSDHPQTETTFNVEFYISSNDVVLENNKLLDIFRAFSSTPVNHLQVQFQWKDRTSNYKIWVWARENSDVNSGKPRFIAKITLVPATENLFRVEWAAGDGNGYARVYKNGGLKGEVATLTNDEHDVEYVRLGLPKGSLGNCPGGGCTGSFFVDEYVSTR